MRKPETKSDSEESTVQPASTQTRAHTLTHTLTQSSLSIGHEGYRYIRDYSTHTMRYKGKTQTYQIGLRPPLTHMQLNQGTNTQVLFHTLKTQHTGEQKCITAASGSSRFNRTPIHLSLKTFVMWTLACHAQCCPL